jgi:RNA polymerase sigma factor (sigma-70 family)
MHQLGSREEAEDAVQTTFMNAFRALGRGVVPEAESAWLFKIAENVCLSRRRSSWRRGRIESPSDFDVIEEIVPGPSRQRDELIGIEDALASMPEQQRRAILLREWQGLSYREISQELELSQSAVETLIFRARRSLAQGLEQPDLLKKPKRKSFRRALHMIDLGTIAAAAKTLLAGSVAVKATSVAVAVTAAATAGSVTPKLEGHSPKSSPAPALVAPKAAEPAAASAPFVVAIHDQPAPQPAATTPTATPARWAVGQPQARTSGTASRTIPVAVAPAAPTSAPAAAPSAEPAAPPVAAEPTRAPVAETPILTPTPVQQPTNVEPAPAEPAIIDAGSPKVPNSTPVVPAPTAPVGPLLGDKKRDVPIAPAPEPVAPAIVAAPAPVGPAPTVDPVTDSQRTSLLGN